MRFVTLARGLLQGGVIGGLIFTALYQEVRSHSQANIYVLQDLQSSHVDEKKVSNFAIRLSFP